ncbi:hypothetical protein L0990_02135 [Vibrio kanaloae]|jgi:hypothetical protein|uniref:Uncharacterized protein n=3 Tax=Vibrio TaxID=662 RepID=A0ABX6R2Y0_9VIBR|nr:MULTISPECIES: hypothetical protein [Vibrio]MCO7068016.1 hypothetical protein [Vibrio paracholerae]QMV15500.1 hypothetical protein Vspart_02820 [Vibrio spartinae]SJZ56205.1 hypothetical protein SAMN02745782_00664 [Vibrio cincinnatiensis DSM 19608]SUP06116.1 Uncharacterised protein [Vibrio cincinnatiensis]
MTNSLRQTSILIISILAMLMSSYVSSMPMMDMSPISTSSVQPSNHDSMEMSETTASHYAMIGCPSMEVTKSDSSIHCDSSSTSGGDCCKSVCTSVFFPLSSSRLISTSESDLALRHPIKIGVTVTRIQSLLRPPSV